MKRTLALAILCSAFASSSVGASPARPANAVGKKAAAAKQDRSSVLVVMYRGPRFNPLAKRNLSAKRLAAALAKRNKHGEVSLIGTRVKPNHFSLTLAKRNAKDGDPLMVTWLGGFSHVGETGALLEPLYGGLETNLQRYFPDFHMGGTTVKGELHVSGGVSKLVATGNGNGLDLIVETATSSPTRRHILSLGRLDRGQEVRGTFDLGRFGWLKKLAKPFRGYVTVPSPSGPIYVESLQIDPNWLSLGPLPADQQ